MTPVNEAGLAFLVPQCEAAEQGQALRAEFEGLVGAWLQHRFRPWARHAAALGVDPGHLLDQMAAVLRQVAGALDGHDHGGGQAGR